jgi:hypothetical protein
LKAQPYSKPQNTWNTLRDQATHLKSRFQIKAQHHHTNTRTLGLEPSFKLHIHNEAQKESDTLQTISMAEIVGLLASVTALAELATKISLQSVNFVKDVKAAPNTIPSLTKEAKSLRSVLNDLEDNLKDVNRSGHHLSTRLLHDLSSVLVECGNTLEGTQRKLGKFQDPDLIDKLKFVFAERSIAKLHLALEGHQGHKTTLIIAWLRLVQYALKCDTGPFTHHL